MARSAKVVKDCVDHELDNSFIHLFGDMRVKTDAKHKYRPPTLDTRSVYSDTVICLAGAASIFCLASCLVRVHWLVLSPDVWSRDRGFRRFCPRTRSI